MIDIVIVNWNSGMLLRKCIESIQKYGSKYVNRLIVVDNSSSDASLNDINYDDAIIIYAGENLGFGKACNLGAQKSNSKYLLFLNPDAALYPDTLESVLIFMNKPLNADVGICGVQLVDSSSHVSRNCTRFPAYWAFVAHAIGIDKLLPSTGYFMSEWAHDSTRDVDHVIGAFYLVRRQLFEAIGGFDEQFFVYLEDLDFSYRAHQAGWQSVYLTDVQAYHAGGGTSNQVKAKRLFYSLRSRLLYAFKHFHLLGALVVLLTTLFIEPISRSVLAVSRRSWSSLTETWQGYGMLWRWLPQWIFKGVTR
jgi:GT2 family glycosyltransferase